MVTYFKNTFFLFLHDNVLRQIEMLLVKNTFYCCHGNSVKQANLYIKVWQHLQI